MELYYFGLGDIMVKKKVVQKPKVKVVKAPIKKKFLDKPVKHLFSFDRFEEELTNTADRTRNVSDNFFNNKYNAENVRNNLRPHNNNRMWYTIIIIAIGIILVTILGSPTWTYLIFMLILIRILYLQFYLRKH
jgi:hypothetical protein